MWRILTLAFLATMAFAQTAPLRITADEAAKHLLSGPQPAYPQLAQQARVQGNVILELGINESGSTVNIRLVSGHPMLVTAAVQAVSHWKYEPIQVNGKPVSVVTDVVVTFGDKKFAAMARPELTFRYDFWTAEESAEAAIGRKDYTFAEEQLIRAQQTLGTDSHPREKWQWLTTSGQLRALQKRYDEAEQCLKDALAQVRSNANGTLVAAISLSNLGDLFAEEKKFDLAYQNTSQSLAIYKTNFKEARDSGMQKMLGQRVLDESLRLLKIAESQKDEAQKSEQCRTLAEFQAFQDSSQQASVAESCSSLKTQK